MIRSEYFPGRSFKADDKEMLYFSGTAYLGLPQHEAYKELIREGVDKYGVHFSGSRNGNIRYSLYEEAETYLANWLGTEDALVTSSGLAAGQLLIKCLEELGWTMEYAPAAHPALWRSAEDNTGGDFTSWVTMTKLQLEGMLPRKMVLFCNSCDPLFCDPVHFDWLNDITDYHDVLLVVDDSHGIGVAGRNGEGVSAKLRKLPSHIRWVVTASLGKGPSLAAGFIAGPMEVLEKVRQSPWFIGASPAAPAFLHALINGTEIRASQLKKLRKYQMLFGTHSLVKRYLHYQPDLPVFFCANQRLYKFLLSRNIVISHFAYPRPDSRPISRVVLHAALEQRDLGKLLEEMKTFFEEFS